MSGKSFVGKVVSNKMNSTVVVLVDMSKRHPLYSKLVKRHKRIKAHADQKYEIGDVVRIVETRPCAKTVSFKVLEKIS